MQELHTLTIRVADSTDAKQIANLHAISWQSAYKNMLSDDYLANRALADRLNVWLERFSTENQHRYNTFLAHQGEKLVGFICMILDADNTWGTLIDNLHIHPNCKRMGIGRLLMQHVTTWIEEKRPNSPLHLFVYKENIDAQSFYRKLGAQEVEQLLELRNDGQYKYSVRYAWQNAASLTGILGRGAIF